MHNNVRSHLLLIVTLLILLFSGTALARNLTVGWSAVSALNAPFWVMNDAGFLKKEGLDVKLVYIPSSSTIAQAQLSGNVDVSSANSQVIVDADLTGCDWVAIGAVTNAVAFYVMANPEISKVTDLKGRKLGVTRFWRFDGFCSAQIAGEVSTQADGGRSDPADRRNA